MELGSQGIRVHNQFLSAAPDKPRDSSVTCCFALGIPLQKNQQVGISTGYKSLQLLLGTENVESFQEKKNQIHASFRHCLLPFLKRQFVDATLRPGSKLETLLSLQTVNYSRTHCWG